MNVDLAKYDNSQYDPGRSAVMRSLWYVVNAFCFSSYLLPLYAVKRSLLRIFGARIGHKVMIKPNVNIKYPWNLDIGDHVWIGEGAWLDSLGMIKIGSNVCISQGAYLCTGNHNWSDPAFALVIKPIVIETGVWLGANAVVLPGVTIHYNAVVTAGSVLSHDAERDSIYQGNPAIKIRDRVMR